MAYWIWRHRTIGICGIETLLVDKILRRYIEIGGVEPLVVDKIFRRYIVIGGVEPFLVDILIVLEYEVRFFGGKSQLLRQLYTKP